MHETSIDWLFGVATGKHWNNMTDEQKKGVLAQAKFGHKQEIVNSWVNGYRRREEKLEINTADNYYKETFYQPIK